MTPVLTRYLETIKDNLRLEPAEELRHLSAEVASPFAPVLPRHGVSP